MNIHLIPPPPPFGDHPFCSLVYVLIRVAKTKAADVDRITVYPLETAAAGIVSATRTPTAGIARFTGTASKLAMSPVVVTALTILTLLV